MSSTLFEQAKTWETSRLQQNERSKKRAWFICYVSWAITALLGFGIAVMLPLKETIPYVVRVDSATGIPDIVNVLNSKEVGYSEVMDKYWLARFVRSRESYNWYTIQTDYDTTRLLSGPETMKEYTALFEGKNALDKVYGRNVDVTIKIISIVWNKSGQGTVRFIKTTKRIDTGAVVNAKYVATIGYLYRNPSSLTDKERLINPFAWKATSYRVDSELIDEAKELEILPAPVPSVEGEDE